MILKFLINPSSFKIFAMETFIFDEGISTFRCPALMEFLILVSISEIGSEIPLISLLPHKIILP
jgi:hypothetical protein